MCTPKDKPRSGPPSVTQGHVGWTRHRDPRPSGGPVGRGRVQLPGKGKTRRLYQETPDMCTPRKRPAPVVRPKPRPDATHSDDTPPWRGWDFFRGVAGRVAWYARNWRPRDHEPQCPYRRVARVLTFGATP